MSEQTANTPAAPAAPAAASAQTVVSTPRPVQAAPPATRPKPPQAMRSATNTTTRTYGTKQPAAPAAAAPAPAAPAAPAAEAPAATTAAPETPAPAPADPSGLTAADLPAEAAAATETPAAPAEEAPRVDESELSKRLGRIVRAEQKLTEERQRFATEKQQHAEALRRVQMMDQAQEHAKRDPLGFMARVHGISTQTIVDHLIAQAKGVQPGQPSQPGAPMSPAESRLEAIERQLRESEQATKRQQEQARVNDYIAETIRPMVSDKSAFPYLNHEFGGGADKMVYDTMLANYKRTGKSTDPRVVAEFVEKQLSAKYRNAPGNPAQPATPKPPLQSAPRAGAPQPASARTAETPTASTPKPVSAQPPAVPGRRIVTRSPAYVRQSR